MHGNPTDTAPVNVSNSGDAMGVAWAGYKHDQLRQAQATAFHGAELRDRARERIAEAAKVLSSAPSTALAGSPEQAGIDQYHALHRMLDEVAFYPAHDKRAESPAYAKVHHQMTVVEDRHCLVCGVQHSTLGDPAKNPFGAIAMETHHHTIEWALANAVDPASFNTHILPGLRRQAQQRKQQPGYAQVNAVYKEFDDDYGADMSGDRIKEWVDHSPDNLWVLCDVHHRHKFVGIHAITYPIWGPQDVVDAELIAQEIEQTKSAGSKSAKGRQKPGGGQ